MSHDLLAGAAYRGSRAERIALIVTDLRLHGCPDENIAAWLHMTVARLRAYVRLYEDRV